MEKKQPFTQWEVDMDIPDIIWNNYLKKYFSDYVMFRGEEGTWKIKCRFGQIEPYSLKKGLLLFYGNFPTPAKKTYFLKKKPKEVEVVSIDYSECVLKFYEKSLSNLLDFFKVRKRIKLSESERKRRGEQIKQIRKLTIGGIKNGTGK